MTISRPKPSQPLILKLSGRKSGPPLCLTGALIALSVQLLGCGGSTGTTSPPAKTVPAITWPTPGPIVYGTSLTATQLDATANVAGTFSYSPAAGTLESAGSDTLSATFTPADTTTYALATASVVLTVSQAVPTVIWPTPAPIAHGTALSATQLNATSSVPGAFVYSPAAGAVEATGTDTLSVTFTPTDAVNYTTATAAVKLAVTSNPTAPTITWATPASIVYGTPLSATQFDATASVAGTFAYSPAVSTIEPAGGNVLSVTFTPTDTQDYLTATASVQLTVTQATPTITWAAPAPIVSGTALSSTQLDATANIPGAFVYSPAAGTVEPIGTDTLFTTFTPTDTKDYTNATASVQLTVTSNQLTPTITWATPSAITYGTALSATQLDATASVPGTFVYSPAAGAVEPVGIDVLSVTFTPADTKTYSTATASVDLTVTAVTASTLDTLSFIQQMVNLDSLAEYPGPATIHGLIDSKDPRAYGPSATCFYCDVDGGNFFGDMTLGGVAQHVMLNIDGPGVVTRLEVLGPNFTGHNLRVYVDNSTQPALQADLQQLMQGQTPYVSNALAFQGGTTITSVLGNGVPAPGLSLYLPIPFSKHILVTYDGPENVSPTDQPAPVLDWILEYKLLPAGSNVTSYSITDYNNNLPAITSALKALSPESIISPSAAPGPFTDAAASSILNQSIPAGGSVSINLPSGPNAVRFLQTNLGSSAATLAGVTLSMTFDGEQTVASVPAGSFFGSGNGTTTGGHGLNNGATMTQSVASDGTLTSRWTMPYQASASITIANTTSSAVNINLLADVAAYTWDSSSMHFHAYRRINGPFETTNDFTSRFLYVLGSGVYVGDNESVYQNQTGGDTAPNWFGEGDEMIYVDANGSQFPQRGTGLEDYFDFAYGNPSFFQAPWASQVAFPPQANGETSYYYDGTTVFNRTRLLDTVPFTKSLRFDFELDDHDQSTTNNVQIDHVAFFYALPGATIVPDAIQSGSTYTIQSNAAGWNLDSTGGSIQTQIFKANGAQQFVLALSSGYYTIQDVTTGKYVAVTNNSTSAGATLSLVPAESGCGMFWTISPASGNNGYTTINNKCSGLNMDIVNASTAPGTTVQQYLVNGTDAQQWRFNLVP